ncbi:hypothetical protein CDCA_CDCA05G1628 [Cyanidium caldarium]|uniref:SAP domain-containing protein n=1 Tax=Cyanidium caldarium TaxID=2771 RepID=A0AAV9ITK1_CYACA|nr:hypothetical protein CDCA_CDCA05G1628 [Cyanidium caldarium]
MTLLFISTAGCIWQCAPVAHRRWVMAEGVHPAGPAKLVRAAVHALERKVDGRASWATRLAAGAASAGQAYGRTLQSAVSDWAQRVSQALEGRDACQAETAQVQALRDNVAALRDEVWQLLHEADGRERRLEEKERALSAADAELLFLEEQCQTMRTALQRVLPLLSPEAQAETGARAAATTEESSVHARAACHERRRRWEDDLRRAREESRSIREALERAQQELRAQKETPPTPTPRTRRAAVAEAAPRPRRARKCDAAPAAATAVTSMNRRELQQLAKQHGIDARQKTEALRAAIEAAVRANKLGSTG